MKFSMKYVFAVLAAVLAVLGARNMAFAEDELYLCGVVKEVDVQNNTISVDVTSKFCRGLKTFKVSNKLDITSFREDESKCFFVEENSCKPNTIYHILKVE